MKKHVLSIVLITILLGRQGFSQANFPQDPLAQLLSNYYSIKEALVTANSTIATASALQFIKTLNSIDYKIISEGNINILLKDATLVSETGDLQQQRARFGNLSDNLIVIAKAVKLSTQPVYLVYCPTKRLSWLSSEKVIRNPYGDEPNCGEIVETIQ